jgi:putative FmdB family regulatory protein
MPTYEYRCGACQETFEEFLPLAKRKKPEQKPCPNCSEKRVKQTILSTPNVGVDMGKDIHKASGGFKDAMQKVCEAPGIKGSKREKDLKARYNL